MKYYVSILPRMHNPTPPNAYKLKILISKGSKVPVLTQENRIVLL